MDNGRGAGGSLAAGPGENHVYGHPLTSLAGYVIWYGVPVSWPVGADARRANCAAPERTDSDSAGIQVCITKNVLDETKSWKLK